MRIVSISDDFLKRFATGDREFMPKRGRPCLLVVRLKFRGRRRDFAVPFRSNIAPNIPKSQYFALPPRPTTKPQHRHGIHYIKMFPVERRFLRRFRTDGNSYYETIERILAKHEREIVSSCQHYLLAYERVGKPRYAVDLDRLIALLDRKGDD